MTGFVRSALVLVVAIAPSVTFAGYDKTNWGMPLRSVKRLYPGGVMQRIQNNDVVYSVVRPVAGFMTALVSFTFSRPSNLKAVHVLFPEQGSEVDLKAGTYTPMNSEDVRSVYDVLVTRLTLKYGDPDPLSKGSTKAWAPQNGDFISLSTSPASEPGVAPSVGILYSRLPAIKDLSSGL